MIKYELLLRCHISYKNLDLFFGQYPVIMCVSKSLGIEVEKCSNVRCASAGTTGSTFAKNTSSKQQHYSVHAVITESLVTIFFRLQRSGIFNEACFNNFLFKFPNRFYARLHSILYDCGTFFFCLSHTEYWWPVSKFYC